MGNIEKRIQAVIRNYPTSDKAEATEETTNDQQKSSLPKNLTTS